MKKTNVANKRTDDLRPEYEFDYSKSRANRFASGFTDSVVAVVLDADVAQVFQSSASVNRLLRSVIEAVPKSNLRSKKRRKAS